MNNLLVDGLIEILVRNQIVQAEEKEIYSFGLSQLFVTLLNVLTPIIIGVFLDMLLQSLLFLTCYIPLRSFAGGYHAKTQLRCYCSSIGMLIVSLLIIKCIPWNLTICTIFLFTAAIVIFAYAPVENKNKPLDSLEYSVFRRTSRLVFLAESLVTVSLIGLQLEQMAGSVTIAVTVAAVMVLLGK